MNSIIQKINALIATPQMNKAFRWTNLVLIYGSFFLPAVLFVTREYLIFGSTAWALLIIIMASRPLGDIFPTFLLFRRVTAIRRGIGIACGMAALTHGIGFFYLYPEAIGASYLWATNKLFLYGIVALVFSTLLLVTSNNVSIRLMGKYWKWLHKGVYGMFYVVCIHVALVGYSGIHYEPLVIGGVIFLLRLAAWWKKRPKTPLPAASAQ